MHKFALILSFSFFFFFFFFFFLFFHNQWENEVASLLKSDMRSLTQEEEEGGTMTMQERVIQSGNET